MSDDAELLAKARGGDPAAVNALLERHERSIYRFGLRMCRDPEDAKEMARRLAREEGIFGGTSSGANVLAAIALSRELGPGSTVVTLICDSGLKYLNTDVYRRA